MSADHIVNIKGRELIDSKGRPMIEVEVECAGGAKGFAAAPCGTSVGSYEGMVLRDHGVRFGGLGTLKAVEQVKTSIAPGLSGMEAFDQNAIDKKLIALDGTEDKSKLGANTIYSTSVAVARAAAVTKNMPLFKHLVKKKKYLLPKPMLNSINGGTYGEINCGIQEFLTIPVKMESFAKTYRKSVEIFYAIEKRIKQSLGTNQLFLGNSLGHAAPYAESHKNIDLLIAAIEDAGYGDEFVIGLDCAANEFYDSTSHLYHLDNQTFDTNSLSEYWIELIEKYPLHFLEDPFCEDDFEAHQHLTHKTDKVYIAGDDLLATNPNRLKIAAGMGACNAIIFKPNMIGTVSEALETAVLAHKKGYNIVPSIRSGGGVDDPIADFALAVGAGFIKCGAPRSGERIVVQNQLLRLEEILD